MPKSLHNVLCRLFSVMDILPIHNFRISDYGTVHGHCQKRKLRRQKPVLRMIRHFLLCYVRRDSHSESHVSIFFI